VVEEIAHVAMPQKAWQKEWRRSLVHVLRQKAQEHCGEGIPDEACLLELGWYTREVIVLYVECKRCGRKRYHVEENREQGVISGRQKWCGCQKRKETEVVHPKRGKVQQSGAWVGVPESAAKEKGRQREVKWTFKMLREVWLNIGVEKINTHKGVAVKALLDSGTTEMFMDNRTAAKHGFMLQKLERSIMVRNVDGTNNSGGAITHQVEANVYYKGHVERMRMDVCDLGKIEVILGMPWLQAHNPEINWETGEVKITRCPPLYGRTRPRGVKKGKRVATLEEEKIIRWTINDKEDWGREEEIEEDHRKIEELVPKKFLKWRKVFGKVESERMPTRKV